MNSNYLIELDTEEKIRDYAIFLSQGGIKSIPRSNTKNLVNFLKNKKEDYLNGLKFELKSPIAKIRYCDIYFVFKSLEFEKTLTLI